MSNICVIDIGSHSIKAVLAEKQRGFLNLLASVNVRSKGIRRSGVYDMEGLTASIEETVEAIEKRSGKSLRSALILISGPFLLSQRARGTVIISKRDGEITTTDIERVRQTAESAVMTPNRYKLHNIVYNYILDGAGGLIDPIGMRGTKLEAESIFIDTLAHHVKHFDRCLEEVGIRPLDYRSGSLMGATNALSDRDSTIGAAAIDWGASTITISVFEEGKPIHFATLNQGSDLITNDLGIGLRVPIDIAEAIKIQYGSAFPELLSKKENISLAEFDPSYEETISRKMAGEIIQARVEDQFRLINSELKKIGKDGRLPGGIVFYGGGAKLQGIIEQARRSFYLTARLGISNRVNPASEEGQDQSFMNVIGGARYAFQENMSSGMYPLQLAKRFFRLFVP